MRACKREWRGPFCWLGVALLSSSMVLLNLGWMVPQAMVRAGDASASGSLRLADGFGEPSYADGESPDSTWTDRADAQRTRAASQVQRLRWQPSRVRTLSASPSADGADARSLPAAPREGAGRIAVASWEARGNETARSVRHVQSSSTDPFQDPFGDRQAQDAGGGYSEDLGLNAAGGARAEAFSTQDVQPMPLQPGPMPNGQVEPPDQLPPQVMPPNGEQPQSDCQRIYNDRNCCDQVDTCAQHRSLVQGDSIANVKLDITPRFRPDEEDLDEEAALKSTQLERAEPRSWKNRQGEVLAFGKFTNYINGRIIVTQNDGQIVEVPYSELADDDVCFVAAWWQLPMECTLSDKTLIARNWTPLTYTWKASGTCHKPLYFEEVQLERYGHTMGPVIQPLASGAHFFGSIIALPYTVGIHPPNECQYPLGYYRPGNCAPWLVPPVPISLRAGLMAGGFYSGMPFIIP